MPHLISVNTFIQLLQTTGNNFSDFISNNINTFMELLPNNTTHFPRNQTILTFSESLFQIKQQKKKFFQSTYHTIMTLSESYYQTKLTYSALKSSSIHTFTQLLPNNNRHFFWESEWTLEQTKHSQTENSQLKMRKVSIHTWNR